MLQTVFLFLYKKILFVFEKAIAHEEQTIRLKIFNTWLDRAHSKLIDNEQNVRIFVKK